MPKLLVASTIPITIWSFLHPLVANLRGKGWIVDGAANGLPEESRCIGAFDHCYHVSWTRSPKNVRAALTGARELRTIVGGGHYDIVHAHTPLAGFIARAALSNLNGRSRPVVIYTAHGFHFHPQGTRLRNSVFRTVEKIAGRWTDFLVVVNKEDEAAALRYKVVPADRVVRVPGVGIELDRYSPAAIDLAKVKICRAELGLGENTPLILMLADFTPEKRHIDLLQALRLMRNRECHLVLAGDGPLLDATKQKAQALGIADRVHFLGFRDDVPLLLHCAAVSVLPSSREGLPRAVMESLAMETPVVASSIRGSAELLEGGGGLLYPVGDCGELAQCLDQVLDQPERAREMGRRGAESMRAYATDVMIARHLELYARALRSRTSAGDCNISQSCGGGSAGAYQLRM
ncbi:MAG: glycosyltransferase [Terracidiphilus sp.]|jgi:glycosyltransferase involved in cell wall biosynthesis